MPAAGSQSDQLGRRRRHCRSVDRPACFSGAILILLNVTIEVLSETSIQVTKFYVPSKAFLNEEVNLTCRYELSNELLYTMKLFKDNQELYRFTPKGKPEDQKMAFHVAGVQVNLARSNGHEVYIRPRDLQATGIYKCKVMVESTFRSALSKEKHMEVVQATRRRANDNQLATSAWSQRDRLGPNQRRQPLASSGAVQQFSSSRSQAGSSGAAPPSGPRLQWATAAASQLGAAALLLLLLTSRPFVGAAG